MRRATTTILHISDIHAGKHAHSDDDIKANLPNATTRSALDVLAGYLTVMKQRPDLVVISGDITIRADRTGLEQMRDWLFAQIGNGCLPGPESIMIVPGNHDVTRRTHDTNTPQVQYRDFWEVFGTAFPHALIPHYDPRTPTTVVADKRVGGIKKREHQGRVLLEESLPYILDLDRDVLIYGFNSTHGCGAPLDPDPEILRPLEAMTELNKNPNLIGVKNAYLDSLIVDAGQLTPDQINVFNEHMRALNKALGSRLDSVTKIAVLHHHVSHLWMQQLELKVFESIVDASQFKQALTENRFDMVLHGHKHTNHVGLDGALIPIDQNSRFNPLCIVSGGTVGGYPAPDDRRSFKLIELQDQKWPRRSAIVKEVPLKRVNVPSLTDGVRTFNVPLADRIPRLHDIQPLKNSLDQIMMEEIAPELAKATARSLNVELKLSEPNRFAATNVYRCFAVKDDDPAQKVYYEAILATRALQFVTMARLHWFVNAVASVAPGAKAVIMIGVLEGTHYSEAVAANETLDSIKNLEEWLAPAIQAQTVEIRTHAFRQEEAARAAELSAP